MVVSVARFFFFEIGLPSTTGCTYCLHVQKRAMDSSKTTSHPSKHLTLACTYPLAQQQSTLNAHFDPDVHGRHDCFALQCDFVPIPRSDLLKVHDPVSRMAIRHQTISKSLYRWRIQKKVRPMTTVRAFNQAYLSLCRPVVLQELEDPVLEPVFVSESMAYLLALWMEDPNWLL